MAAVQVGDKLPDITLRTPGPDGPKPVKTGEYFKGRKVVLFAVPGAFTGTCTKQHLPSFLENAEQFKAKGVAEVACVAVNDPFVMDAWGKSLGTGGRVTLLSDGNGEFTKAIGMAFDGSGHGLGTRSRRYAMLVQDGIVKTLQVEDNPGQCTVSSAAAILEKL